MDYLTQEPIDVEAWHRETINAWDGASVEFLGIVRGQEGGRDITHLEYEAYLPMAERVMGALVEEAKKRWPLHRVFLHHRVGRIKVGEASVLIGVQAPHREEAFEACRFLIEAIKKEVPIWKGT